VATAVPKQAWRKAAGAIGAVIAATLLIEGAIRLFILSPVATVTHPTLGRLMQPHAYYREATEGGSTFLTNRLGFNDIDPPAKRASGILVVGDSYVEALQVPRDENFASVFRRLYPDEAIASAGRAGLSPLSYKYVLDYVRPAFTPRFVVLVLNHSDIADIRDSRVAVERSAEGKIVALANRENVRPEGAEADAFRFLVAHSSIFAMLNLKYIDTFKSAAAVVRQAASQIGGVFSSRAETRRHSPTASPDAALGSEELVEIATLLLGEIKSEVPVGVVYVPLLEYKSGDRTLESARSLEAGELFSQAAARAGVGFLDLGPALRDEFVRTGLPPAGFSNTAPGEGHLNAAGHVLLARAIELVAAGGADPAKGVP
jgi:hypothetical protein